MSAVYTEFSDRTALVTGAGQGIGKAVALAFASQGANVVVSDVLETEGAAVAQEIIKRGQKAIFVRCDVSDESEVTTLVSRALSTFGGIDYAINNAGIEGQSAPTAGCTRQNWDRVIAVNLTGVWLCMKYQIPEMLKQGAGSIVNISSIAGLVGFQGSPAYVASKHGVVGLTKTAALECAKSRVRINAICPGVIQTPMIDRFTQQNPSLQDSLAQAEPMGRIGTASEIANAVLWLCSSGASFVTGHPLTVDGGWVAQ